jgi:hypothetical protein
MSDPELRKHQTQKISRKKSLSAHSDRETWGKVNSLHTALVSHLKSVIIKAP